MTPCFIISVFSIAVEAFPGGTHYINDKVRLEALSDEHKARVSDYLDKHEEERLSRNVRQRPVFIIPYNEIHYLRIIASNEEKMSNTLQMHRFALEYFSSHSLPMAIFSYNGNQIVSHSVRYNELVSKREASSTLFDRGWERHTTYLNFLYESITVSPAADVVINRLCRAFKQGPTDDGIIDLAIALERLVSAKIEIKFQFALFHSLINSDSPADRKEIFKILQELYDIRSQTVHGSNLGKSDKKKMKKIEEEWTKILGIARENLTYYLVFCKKNGSDKWDEHLRDLSFGCPRISLDGMYDQA